MNLLGESIMDLVDAVSDAYSTRILVSDEQMTPAYKAAFDTWKELNDALRLRVELVTDRLAYLERMVQ